MLLSANMGHVFKLGYRLLPELFETFRLCCVLGLELMCDEILQIGDVRVFSI